MRFVADVPFFGPKDMKDAEQPSSKVLPFKMWESMAFFVHFGVLCWAAQLVGYHDKGHLNDSGRLDWGYNAYHDLNTVYNSK